MGEILSFEDFKKSKDHQKKVTEIEGVVKTLSHCQRMLAIHRDYLIIQKLMGDINLCVEKFQKIKELEELHYEYQNQNKEIIENEEIPTD